MRESSKPAAQSGIRGLVTIRPQVAGMDIGSTKLPGCGPLLEDGTPQLEVFATTTRAILTLAQWLRERQVESVAMESTGVYWIPVLERLESQGLEGILVDSRPRARVPGRKTDLQACQWIQWLHRGGLRRGCYRPTEAICQLRTRVRDQGVLVAEQSDGLRGMQKCLDQRNVRVHQAVADLPGTTGRAMVRAMVAGERDPVKLAQRRDPRC